MKVLALHLTKPSSSEANVLFNLLEHLDQGISVELVTNRVGLEDRESYFARLSHDSRVAVYAADVGLPTDPQAKRTIFERMASRVSHMIRRRDLVRLAEEIRPDLVYTSQQRFDCYVGELIAERLGVPHVVHLHYTPDLWLRRRALERLRTCSQVIAVSRFIGRLAEESGVASSKIVVLHNAIDVHNLAETHPAKPSSGRIKVGQIGRMAPGKGFEDSMRAFAKLRTEQPAMELVLVGDGAERRRLEDLARSLGVGHAVTFAGWQADARQWLRTFDIFISPSRGEPFGLAALEASAAGVPIVGYDEGGTAEIVANGETGLLARPGDLSSLAEALLRLAKDADLRVALGCAGRRRVATAFNPGVAGRTFSRLLRETAAGGR